MSANAREIIAYLDSSNSGGLTADAIRVFVRKFGLQDRVSEEDIQNLLLCYGGGGGQLDARAVEALVGEQRTVSQRVRWSNV